MAAYLKIEEVQDHANISLRDDAMGLSLLALLTMPFALSGLMLYSLSMNAITVEMKIVCAAMVIAALPKLFQMLTPLLVGKPMSDSRESPSISKTV